MRSYTILAIMDENIIAKLAIFCLFFSVICSEGLSNNAIINWNYDNDAYWNSDSSNLYEDNPSLATGVVECQDHRLMWGTAPEKGNITFAWMKKFVNEEDSPPIDYINFSFYKGKKYIISCETGEWSKLYNYMVHKDEEIKFELFCESPPCDNVQGWIYYNYSPISANHINQTSAEDLAFQNSTCIIHASSSLSSIIKILQKPFETYQVEEGANLQYINDALEILQKNNSVGYKELKLQNGVYNGSINVCAKNFSIKSENGKAILRSNESSDFCIFLHDTSNVRIDGLEIENGQYGIYLLCCNNCDIRNNFIYAFNTTGLLIAASTEGHVENNNINSSKLRTSGIGLDSSKKLMFCLNNFSVNDYEYYFQNQSCSESKCYIGIDTNFIIDKYNFGIYDNGEQYFIKNSTIFRMGKSKLSCGKMEETVNNIWEVLS